MELGLLRTFLAVYRSGSLTAAAPVLGLSQPTITAQLRSLERALDKRLFERLPRGVAPTSVAEDLARRVAPHLDALATIGEHGLDTRDPFRTPVHLAGPAELMTSRVLPTLADLVRSGLRLRVSLGLSGELLGGLATGDHDLVISTIRPRGKAIAATALTDEEFVLVAAPEWADRLDARQLRTDPSAALRNVPLISYAEDLPVIRRYWRTAFGARPKGSAAVVIPDLRGVLAATAAGCGITVLPRYLCADELADGRLVALLEPEVPPINTLFLAVRSGTAELPHIAAVHSRITSRARLWLRRMTEFTRKTVDVDAYAASRREAPCFVCGIVNGDPEHDHEVFYDDGDTIAFLNRYPTLLGYSLVCPKLHVEDLCEDVTTEEYLATQTVVHKVARALKRVVPTERVYVMSLGSMSGNRHVHWHVAPLPPGVPYRRQQFHSLMMETNGVLDMDPAHRAELAERLRREIA